MLPELRMLLEDRIRITKEDHIVSAGDLLDKGPDSPGVIRYSRGLREQGFRFDLVLGNHEEKHERFRRHARREQKEGIKNPMRNGTKFDELSAITEGLSDADVAFLETAVLYVHLPEHNALVVHAGVTPSNGALPADFRQLKGKEKDRAQQMLRVRYVGPNGYMVPLGGEIAGRDVHWTNIYDGRFGHVFYGHEPYLQEQPERTQFATGIDLGCVFGGHLCAAVLHEGQKGTEYVMVKASGKFATGLWE